MFSRRWPIGWHKKPVISVHVLNFVKLQQLMQSHIQVKDYNNLSGRSRKSFELFMEVGAIMGDRPITKLPSFMDSSDVDSKSDCGNSFTDVEESSEQVRIEEHCQGIKEGETLIDIPIAFDCSIPESILTCKEASKTSQEDEANSEHDKTQKYGITKLFTYFPNT